MKPLIKTFTIAAFAAIACGCAGLQTTAEARFAEAERQTHEAMRNYHFAHTVHRDKMEEMDRLCELAFAAVIAATTKEEAEAAKAAGELCHAAEQEANMLKAVTELQSERVIAALAREQAAAKAIEKKAEKN